ncbi:MAG: J domain-containing protein [Ethanoligenens sp.]
MLVFLLTFLRVLLLIVLAPVVAALAIIVAFARFVTAVATVILSVISGALVLFDLLGCLGAFVSGHGHFPHDMILPVVVVFILAFAISPFGLPLVLGLLVELLSLLGEKIRSLYSSDFVCGNQYSYVNYAGYTDQTYKGYEDGYGQYNTGTAHESQEVPTCFQILQFSKIPESISELTKNYRRLAKDAHPDIGGSDERMAVLNQAYQEAKKFMMSV